ncbi:MAG: hypothetical protein EOP38_14480 [Rubrivivax sp.]|nr:MAG: hypothetical protein EOP38_14480 [Rubrivivax sp.]
MLAALLYHLWRVPSAMVFFRTRTLLMKMTGKSILRCLFVVLLPAVYVLFIGRYGWSDTDDGFILGYAWRVLHGDVPYRDFVIVRPPASIYFHTIWFRLLPENWVYLGARYVYVLQILLSAVLSVNLIRRHLQVPAGQFLPWYGMALAGFCLSVGALTPMPWHTVDGVFFGVLALFLVSRDSWPAVLSGGVALFIACTTKQSFYPLLPLYLLLLVWRGAHAKAAFLAVILMGLAGAFRAWLTALDAWPDFLRQTSGATTFQDAINAGFLNYLKMPWRPFLYGLALAGSCRWLAKKRGWHHAPSNDFALMALAFACEMFYRHSKTGEWSSAHALGWSHFAFWLALVAVVMLSKRKWINRDGVLIWLGLLGMAWCSSISWGFQTPLLFATPLVVGGYLLFASSKSSSSSQPKWAYIGLMVLMAIGLAPAWHPYRDARRPELVCDLGTVSSKLSHIVTTVQNCDKLGEALTWASEFKQDRVAFLPAFTLQGYLTGLLDSPLRSNWPMAAELGQESDAYTKDLDASVHYVIIDIQEGDEFSRSEPGSKFHVPSVAHVRQRWVLLRHGRFHELYGHPDLRRKPFTQIP